MKGFRVTGSFDDVRQGKQPYSVEIAAREQVVSTFGSKHKVKRWQIRIDDVKELSNDEIVNHVVKYKVTGE